MTYVVMLKRRANYYGRVLDGPLEGEMVGAFDPYFVGDFSRPVTALYTGLPAGDEIGRAYYKWLPSYRAWAWWQKG